MIDFRLRNCEIAKIDFSLLPKSARQGNKSEQILSNLRLSEFRHLNLNTDLSLTPKTALESAELMKMHLKSSAVGQQPI